MGCDKKDTVEIVRALTGYAVDVTNFVNTDLIKAKLSAFGEKMFKIVVEHENLACWIALNNTFTRIGTTPWDNAMDSWNGVLFQLGAYHGATTDAKMWSLDHIVFEKEDKTPIATLPNGSDEFAKKMYWINVAAKKTSVARTPPMSLHDLSRLKLDPPEPIHQYFTPYMGGLTFWHDREDGYTMEATKNILHNSYTFSCKRTDALEVTVYENDSELEDGAGNKIDFKDTATIRLVAKSPTDPDDAQNPPQRPGYSTFSPKTP